MELHGKPLGELALLRDISAYASLSSELDRVTDLSKELNAIIDSSFDGIYVTDGKSRTLRVNHAYRITSYNVCYTKLLRIHICGFVAIHVEVISADVIVVQH